MIGPYRKSTSQVGLEKDVELQQVLDPGAYDTPNELEATHQLPFQQRNSHPADRAGYYLKSLILLFVWILFTAGVLALFEYAAYRGPRDANPPWRLTQLPSLLMIVFAQGHTVVTGAYLGRLALSVVTGHRRGPHTWRELFWLADHSWEGPVGIVTSLSEARRRKIKLSWMYILFVVTCVVALITPLLWERAYPQESIVVIQQVAINSSVVNLKSLDRLEGFGQMSVASGPWFSGLSVSELFNASVYEPEKVSSSRSETQASLSFNSDFFFAGDVASANATLPGFKHTGGCQVIPDLAGLDPQNISSSFNALCPDDFGSRSGTFMAHTRLGIMFNVTGCSRKNSGTFFLGQQANSTNEAYFYFNTTYGYGYGTEQSNSTIGLVLCKSVTTAGNAYVSGLDGTYKDFAEEVPPASSGRDGEPGFDPLYLIWYYLTDLMDDSPSTPRGIIRGLGFIEGMRNSTGIITFNELSNEEIAQGLWKFAQHAVFATVTLHREEMPFADATLPIVVSAFSRDTLYAAGAYAMLALWLVLVLGLTMVGFRKTFGNSFDGYVLTKMVLERPELLGRGTPIADSAENEKLDTAFDYKTL